MHATTTVLEINVEPLDLLTEFLKVMEDPIQEYVDNVLCERVQMDGYEEGIMLLKDYISESRR